MQRFLIRLIPYIVVAFVVYSIGFCQSQWFAPEGDLVKSSFLITERRYVDPPLLPPARDTLQQLTLLVGDSHLDQRPSTNRFQNYLTAEVSSHSHWAYDGDIDPLSLGIALTDSTSSHRLIVFEMVERNFFFFAEKFLKSDPTESPVLKEWSPPESRKIRFKYFGNGLRTICSQLGLQSKWLMNDVCQIRKCHKALPLYSKSELLITKMVEQRRKPIDEVMPVIDELIHAIKAHLDSLNVDFLIYIIPDKATLYETYCDCGDLHPSFLNINLPNDHVKSPLKRMRESAEAGIMEIFKYSDTHLSATGANIVGQHLDSLISERALGNIMVNEGEIRE